MKKQRTNITPEQSQLIRDTLKTGLTPTETGKKLGYATSTILRHANGFDFKARPSRAHLKEAVIKLYTVSGYTMAQIKEMKGISLSTINRYVKGMKRAPNKDNKPQPNKKLKVMKSPPVDKDKPEIKENPDVINIKPFTGMKRHQIAKGLWVEIDANASCDEVKKIIDRKRRIYKIV